MNYLTVMDGIDEWKTQIVEHNLGIKELIFK
jgi:hypothetical protein